METTKGLPGGYATRTYERRRGFGAVLRGLLAVVMLFVSAADHLLTAVVGIAPLGPKVRELCDEIAETYRDGVEDVRPADVVDPDDEMGVRL